MIDKVIVYRDTVGEWRVSAKAANGEQIVGSSEGYKNHGHAMVVARQVFPGVPIYDSHGHPMPPIGHDDHPLAIIRDPGAGREELASATRQVEHLVDAVRAALAELEDVFAADEMIAGVLGQMTHAYEPFKTRSR